MQGTIISFRRGRHVYTPRQFIIQIAGITTKEAASKLLDKRVSWTSPTKKQIKGIITGTHGVKGLVRARFEKGLPGQAVTTKVEIE